MADYLILTAEQAESLSGPTAPGSALWPVALADGLRFVLPVAVLIDPAHAGHREVLASIPVGEVSDAELATPPSPRQVGDTLG